MLSFPIFIALLSVLVDYVTAFNVSRSDNLAVYYGQNSYGATHGSDPGNWQKTLSTYCQDDNINVIPIAFLTSYFSTGSLPSLDMANICSVNTGVFPGSQLPNCQFLASDIQTCQAKGKVILLSMGGATGSNGFSSDAQAVAFADQIWDLFLGGSSSTRPFGNAVLDGLDLDLEGGSSAGYVAFVNQIRSHTNNANKRYYITAAPQCPFPDAYVGSIIDSVGVDMVFVQFYNNYCGVQNYNNPNAWDYSVWDDWAKNTSPNRQVKVFIGAPAAPSAANPGYYVDATTLGNIALATRSQYSSFGGIMLWDASQAYANNRYDAAIKSLIAGGGGGTQPQSTTSAPISSSSTPTISASPISTSPPASPGNCTGLSAWVAQQPYPGGSQVTYNGHMWTAKYWSESDVPGGASGDWIDNGPCQSSRFGKSVAKTRISSVKISSSSSTTTKLPKSSVGLRSP